MREKYNIKSIQSVVEEYSSEGQTECVVCVCVWLWSAFGKNSIQLLTHQFWK